MEDWLQGHLTDFHVADFLRNLNKFQVEFSSKIPAANSPACWSDVRG